MLISREVKITDGDYGNTTHKLQFELIVPADLCEVNNLLDEWEGILRSREAIISDLENLTVREMKEYEAARTRLNDVLARLTKLTA